jgi:hypothetical protein
MNISHLNYQNNEDLNWFYQPARGTLYYLVHFQISKIERDYDYLTFGPYGTTDVRTKCTGIVYRCPDAYISSSTGIGFNFHSDHSVIFQGFELSVSAFTNSPIPTAAPSSLSHAPTAPTPTPSTLANIMNTQNISHLNYQNNEDLNWFYQPDSGSLYYFIHFTVSQMETSFDYLSFGSYGTNEVRTLCTGRGAAFLCPGVYISSSTGIIFNFHSD